jgi:hypothetical protein
LSVVALLAYLLVAVVDINVCCILLGANMIIDHKATFVILDDCWRR